jgi:hypothetical protein
MHHFACFITPDYELACPRRRELARTGQSQAAGAPIGGLIVAVG